MIDSLWRNATGDRGTQRLAALKHGGLKIPCDLSEMLQRQFYFFGTYFLEETILDCWTEAAESAKVIFDVGANAGIFSLAALAVRPDAIVHAFEPTPEIAAGLRTTAALNGLDRLNVHQTAVAARSGHAALRRFRGELGTNEGMNFISSTADGATSEIVPTVSLDRFCAEYAIDRIDLLKIDIQGNEHQALTGAVGLLGDSRIGTIFTELNWGCRTGHECSASEAIRILEEAGYRFSKPGSPLHWQSSGEWMQSLSDVVARR